MALPERDPSLRRLVRDSAVLCLAASAAALIWQGGRPEGALGVLIGTGLMGFSYRVIRQGVDARAGRALAQGGGQQEGVLAQAWTLTKYVTRYGVIGVAVWAALVPLHASPVGLFAGVSMPVLALGIEAVRIRKPQGPA